jgi:hypothetical protein
MATAADQKDPAAIFSGADWIFQTVNSALEKNEGCLIGRHGTVELEVLLDKKNPDFFEPTLERNAGIFPRTLDSLYEWRDRYTAAVREADGMAAGWYEPLAAAEAEFLDTENPGAKRLPLRSLEPYYASPPWTRALKEQCVAVVSSFALTMEEQLLFKDTIWKGRGEILPDADWKFIRSYYSPALAQGRCGWPKEITSWSDAVAHLEKEVLKTGARVALLGCGGLAMPLALALKRRGLVAIVLGGAIQVLFGIKGRRWEKHEVISKFWNDDWIFPKPEETPLGSRNVEGGCYW